LKDKNNINGGTNMKKIYLLIIPAAVMVVGGLVLNEKVTKADGNDTPRLVKKTETNETKPLQDYSVSIKDMTDEQLHNHFDYLDFTSDEWKDDAVRVVAEIKGGLCFSQTGEKSYMYVDGVPGYIDYNGSNSMSVGELKNYLHERLG
jgi:hypothetical protein